MQAVTFKALKIVHTTLLAGVDVFMVIAVVMISLELIVLKTTESLETVFQVMAAIISMGSLLIGYNLFKNQLVASRESSPGEVKFAMYRGACIMWWAFLEGPGLFATVSYLKTGNMVFIILALFHLAI